MDRREAWWHVVYKAEATESYPPGIHWSVDIYGTLPEAINKLYSIDRVVEVVEMFEKGERR